MKNTEPWETLRGILNVQHKLNEKEVHHIKFHSSGLTSRETADIFNVCHSTILNIRKGKTWKHITKDYFDKEKT